MILPGPHFRRRNPPKAAETTFLAIFGGIRPYLNGQSCIFNTITVSHLLENYD